MEQSLQRERKQRRKDSRRVLKTTTKATTTKGREKQRHALVVGEQTYLLGRVGGGSFELQRNILSVTDTLDKQDKQQQHQLFRKEFRWDM